MKVDLNVDMGESFGMYTMDDDENFMPYITSAKVACGYKAGDIGARDVRQEVVVVTHRVHPEALAHIHVG